MPFGTKELEWLGYPTMKKIEDIFIRFDRMYERDRHTHRQTDRHTHTHTPRDGIGRACIASRGKNQTFLFSHERLQIVS